MARPAITHRHKWKYETRRVPLSKEVVAIPGIQIPDSPFNHVVKVDSLLFLASQLSVDLTTGEILPGDVSEQTRRALENVKFLLESCGASMDDIVKTVVYMKDINDFAKMNRVYAGYFTEGEEPARVTIQALSPIKGIEVEIEVTAVIHS
jgi:2-iminobutanoate/2-iminopropanoate deaminase